MCKGQQGGMITIEAATSAANTHTDPGLVSAAAELEELRLSEQNSSNGMAQNTRFPLHCRRLLYSIAGNTRCVDCGVSNPQWATLSFGALLCIDCSGRHRQLGVQVSVVRSITMDSWKHTDVLAMLEGGNKQLADFFQRHGLSPDGGQAQAQTHDRYRTNAAKFYKKNLSLHAAHVRDAGMYKGRDQFRKNSPQKKKRRIVNVEGSGNGNGIANNRSGNQTISPSRSGSLCQQQRAESESTSSVGAKA